MKELYLSAINEIELIDIEELESKIAPDSGSVPILE
jgi:hypothetical protein